MKAWLVAFLVGGAGAIAGCRADAGASGAAPGDGARIYEAMCAACHGPTGKPTEAMVARMNVRDLTSAALRSRVTPTLVEQQVRAGSTNKLMPAFEGAMSDAQIKAVSAYVASDSFLRR